MERYKSFCNAICVFILNHDEAIKVAVEEIVKIVEKLAPFLIYKGGELQDRAIHSLYKICNQDQYSVDILRKYLKDYGDIIHPHENTSLNKVIFNYKSKRLADLI